MKQKEKALGLLERALKEVEREIECHEKGKGIISDLQQLNRFRVDIHKMLDAIKSDKVPPEKNSRDYGIGYAIVDSWQNGTELGELLLKAENAYYEI